MKNQLIILITTIACYTQAQECPECTGPGVIATYDRTPCGPGCRAVFECNGSLGFIDNFFINTGCTDDGKWALEDNQTCFSCVPRGYSSGLISDLIGRDTRGGSNSGRVTTVFVVVATALVFISAASLLVHYEDKKRRPHGDAVIATKTRDNLHKPPELTISKFGREISLHSTPEPLVQQQPAVQQEVPAFTDMVSTTSCQSASQLQTNSCIEPSVGENPAVKIFLASQPKLPKDTPQQQSLNDSACIEENAESKEDYDALKPNETPADEFNEENNVPKIEDASNEDDKPTDEDNVPTKDQEPLPDREDTENDVSPSLPNLPGQVVGQQITVHSEQSAVILDEPTERRPSEPESLTPVHITY